MAEKRDYYEVLGIPRDASEDDIKKAKESGEYTLDSLNHPNWFEASYISWLSYDSLNIELLDGYLVAKVFLLLEKEIKMFISK